ncbi:MAG: glutamate--tRNA ligase [Thermoproteota archaeon]
MEAYIDLIKYLALDNAEKHGVAKPEVVMGHFIARRPDLKNVTRELFSLVKELTEEVNSMKPEERELLIKALRATYEVKDFHEVPEHKSTLPELKPHKALSGFRLRLAPNPDGPLTLGNARPAILCDYYAKRYKGYFILRFEDTSPSVKPPLKDAYVWILKDLEWLDIKVDEIYYQSDRLDLYYDRAEDFIKMGNAYVCLCKPEDWALYITTMKPCPHRSNSIEKNLELFRMMLDGRMGVKAAVVRIKTEMTNPNPALRDWPALRIDEASHPRVGQRYRVWPLYNWACAVDDHEMNVTHVIRGKEHLTNEARQSYVFKGFGWQMPIVLHVGRLKLEGSVLSKTKIMREIRSGALTGIDDPRVGTIAALRRRGFKPNVIKSLILEMGLKPIEATLKWDNMCSANRVAIDHETPRAFFTWDPYGMKIYGSPKVDSVKIPRHPSNTSLGVREIPVPRDDDITKLEIAGTDAVKLDAGQKIRLMGLFNVIVSEVDNQGREVFAKFYSTSHEDALREKIPIIQWVPADISADVQVLMPNASSIKGKAEPSVSSIRKDDMVQFLRFGFVRCEGFPYFIFTHE